MRWSGIPWKWGIIHSGLPVKWMPLEVDMDVDWTHMEVDVKYDAVSTSCNRGQEISVDKNVEFT